MPAPRLLSLLLPVALTVAAGCARTNDPTAQLTPLDPSHPAVTPLPDPEAQGGNVGRAPRRLNVAQLRQSILVTTGREWTDLPNRAASLGQADYALVNAEGTEPNLVFTKFLEDGARVVCRDTANADRNIPLAQDRVLSRALPDGNVDLESIPDESYRQNLIYLSTRFWGQPLGGAELEAWLGTYKAVAARAESINARHQAQAAMCIAFMTDPRFVTY